MSSALPSASSVRPVDPEQAYVGWVVDNNSPKKDQSIRVVVPAKLTGPVNELPWVLPIQNSLFGCGDNYGVVRVPKIGSRVLVYFQEGDLNLGVYAGDLLSGSYTMAPELAENYPNRVGGHSPNGDVWYYDLSTGDFFLRTPKGTGVSIKGDTGDTSIIVGGNFTQLVKGDYTLQVEGTMTTVVKGDRSSSTGGELTEQVSGSKNQNIGGSYSASVSGSRSITCSSEGHSGPINVQADVSATGISLSSHKHPGVQTGGGLTATPI